MRDLQNWDWETGKTPLADISEINSKYSEVLETVVSDDGKRIAFIAVNEEGEFVVVADGEPWPQTYERAWGLRFSPEGKLLALVMSDFGWTVALDGKSWESSWEFVWAPVFSGDGKKVGIQIKDEEKYGIAIDGEIVAEKIEMIREFAISADGSRCAAPLQTVPRKEADVDGFFAGTWSLVVDGQQWDKTFVNAWGPVFDQAGQRVAAQVRTGIADYTIAVDGEPWDATYGGVWEVAFRPDGGAVAPVRVEGAWTLAEDGALIWNNKYVQLWLPRFSLDGKHIAAVVCPDFGRWTIAVDDKPWPVTFGEMVQAPVFSPDGKRTAAIVKDEGRWSIAVDGKVWAEKFDMIWDPVFSPDGTHVIAMADRGGRHCLVVDGRVAGRDFEKLWPPVFGPDSAGVLLRYVEDGKYCREVLSVADLAGS